MEDTATIAETPAPTKINVSWDEAIHMCEELVRKITSYCAEHDSKVDAIVVLPRGGMIPGERVARRLNLNATQVYAACVAAYEVTGTAMTSDIKTGQMPTRDEIAGKHIWVIDEVCDTGTTLDYIVNFLQKLSPASVHSAVLHYKPTKSKTGFKPDVYLEEATTWINYPWEAPLPQ